MKFILIAFLFNPAYLKYYSNASSLFKIIVEVLYIFPHTVLEIQFVFHTFSTSQFGLIISEVLHSHVCLVAIVSRGVDYGNGSQPGWTEIFFS